MIIWGVNANNHNASLAVFDHDILIFASESERYSKIKNDPDLNIDLINEAKQYSGDPDLIIWHENPYYKTARQFLAGQGWKWKENNIKKYLNKFNLKSNFLFQNHHRSHACSGYFTSEYDQATIICLDNIGEFETASIWKAEGNKLTKLWNKKFPHSLGLWYSAMTQRVGLKPNEEEYILMGMSALGDATRLEKLIYEDFFSDKFLNLNFNLHRGCKYWRSNLNTTQDLYDIAAAVQKIYENEFEKILKLSIKLNPCKNLILSGGCILNCLANSKSFKYFENVWIMPAPGDNGNSIGAVLSYNQKHITWPGPYLGHDLGYHSSNSVITRYIEKNKICGLARGRAEFGPRALGNRSLLADPRVPDIKKTVNNIKGREFFRPFSPAILEEYAPLYFEMPSKTSPYMQYVVRCLEPEKFPGIVHVDGTSRVQTVSKKDNPEFRDLLEKWFDLTGCPMLLNTSLNIKGQPILNDKNDIFNWEKKYNITIFN